MLPVTLTLVPVITPPTTLAPVTIPDTLLLAPVMSPAVATLPPVMLPVMSIFEVVITPFAKMTLETFPNSPTPNPPVEIKLVIDMLFHI